jgi:hypothetical protein
MAGFYEGPVHMLRAAVIVLLIALLPAHALAEGRIALLIGNQAYDSSVGVLKNPYNDIAVVGQALSRQGFEVLPPIKDAKRTAILGGVRDLVRRLNAAGAGAIGFIYYSGHGAAEKDTNINYLIPVDAKEPGTSAFWDESVKLDDVLRLLDGARAAAKFIVFDACRSELQLPTKDTTKGLVPVAEQQGMFIAYASAPGHTASDKGEGSGPYAAALATELGHPGLDHLNLFQNVKEAVLAATGGVQQPWESNGLGRRVYLTGPSVPKPAQSDAELTWPWIKDTNNQTVLENFIKQFGGTTYGAQAQKRLEELRQVAIATPPVRPTKQTSAADPPGKPASPSPMPLPPAERERALGLHDKGIEQLERGNLFAARRLFEQAAEGGLAQSAVALAATYDPDELAKLNVVGLVPDVEAARKWYEKARELGAVEVAERLGHLGASNQRVTAPGEPKKADPPASGFVAVLASKKSRMDALKALAELQKKYAEVLAGKTTDVQEADLRKYGNIVWYRAVVGPPGSREAATSVCSQLKTAGHTGCWVAAY